MARPSGEQRWTTPHNASCGALQIWQRCLVRVPYSSRALFGQNIAEFLPRENNASVYDTLTALTTKLDGLSANSQV